MTTNRVYAIHNNQSFEAIVHEDGTADLYFLGDEQPHKHGVQPWDYEIVAEDVPEDDYEAAFAASAQQAVEHGLFTPGGDFPLDGVSTDDLQAELARRGFSTRDRRR